MASGEEIKELRELVEFLKANDIAEFEMEREDLKVSLKFANAIVHPAATATGMDPATLAAVLAAQGASHATAPLAHAAVVSAPAASHAPAASAAAPADELAGAHVVKSPIVGTFYSKPAPDAEAFAKLGDTVAVGKVLCIVEAMKLMNEIESDGAGEIVKVFVQDGQPVEYGQPLFAIR